MKVKPSQKDDNIVYEENQDINDDFNIDEDQQKVDEFDSFIDEVNDEVEKQETEDKYFTVEETVRPEVEENLEEHEFKSDRITVKSKFPKNATSIECLLTATGYKDRVIASGKELRLLQSRLYYIPVNTDENSDEYSNIKVMSDMSDSIDVRHIKDGYACVCALKHNVKIVDNVRIAVLS